ncbi:hypothetical protein SYJ56_04435 [Algoriphagus sp. D3-2-R+10]|uniref:hypothetical protein n=1 Tax=Algoriphagus aurantiacus TaxID=3103948 RepID=UPI002B37A8D2|nr:hypothetical protein [Algoriphagus sp. D3-2-R+10]MEB2774539.1 hypothetical protein [Algoriphagus sp. D3-2-R+10]
MMKLILLYLIPILLFYGIITEPSFAQDKIEREFGIKENEVPKEARDWLYDAFESTRKIKWYKEVFESGFSYEAKFKLKGEFYSVEFDSLGRIEDVEIEMDFEKLPADLQNGLKVYLSTNYKSSDIKRVQIQYSGEPDDLEDFFDENSQEGIITRYEIEFIGPDETGGSQLWEGLFASDGQLIQKRKIIVSPSENLIF